MATTHEVTDEELPQYIEFVTKDFYPRSVLFSNTAKLKMKSKVDVSIMVDGWPTINCTLMRLPHCEVDGSIAFLLARSQEKLEKFLVESNYNGDSLIVSSRYTTVVFKVTTFLSKALDDETGGFIRCMVKSWPFGLEEIALTTLKAYHYPGKMEDLLPWSCSEGTYVAKLQLEHAGFISDFWIYGEPEARTEMLKYVIRKCSSVGVFLRSDPTHPVSWSLLSNYGHIMHVYTLEEHRGKGYARIVVLSLMQQILKSGLTPALEIAVGNVPSIKLFTGLGFVEAYNSKWKQFLMLEK